MTEIKTIEVPKLGLKPITVNDSMGLQTKVGELQQEIAKIRLEEQKKMVKATRDANVISKLDPKKSEDQKTMERLSQEYDVNLGPFDPDLWSIYQNAIGMQIEEQMVKSTSTNSPELTLKLADLELKFIEDLAGITTKKEKEKFRNSDAFSPADVDEATGKLVRAIMGTEGKEPTEEDSKSDS